MTTSGVPPSSHVESELRELHGEVVRLRAENTRLLRLLELTPDEARSPGPSQTAIFEAAPVNDF